MAISGKVTLEDITIDFEIGENNMPKVIVIDTFEKKQETIFAEADKFMKALAIAVHFDGMPDFNKDYPDAESVMGEIRWIP